MLNKTYVLYIVDFLVNWWIRNIHCNFAQSTADGVVLLRLEHETSCQNDQSNETEKCFHF